MATSCWRTVLSLEKLGFIMNVQDYLIKHKQNVSQKDMWLQLSEFRIKMSSSFVQSLQNYWKGNQTRSPNKSWDESKFHLTSEKIDSTDSNYSTIKWIDNLLKFNWFSIILFSFRIKHLTWIVSHCMMKLAKYSRSVSSWSRFWRLEEIFWVQKTDLS